MDGPSFNGGESFETSGVEADFSFALTDSLYVDFAGSFMSAETSVDMPSFGAVAGDRLPGSVEEQYNVGLKRVCLRFKTILRKNGYAPLW